MKLITRDTDYAVRALDYIARKAKRRVTVSELVKELGIPRPFLRKILQILNKEGILNSYKGRHGGFMLVRPADKIFLIDVMKVFQGPFTFNECFFKKRVCSQVGACILKSKIDDIERRVTSDLKAIDLASLSRGLTWQK